VPAKLATRVRVLSTGHGQKNDDSDALSVGVSAPGDTDARYTERAGETLA
jgi:hypothetical protein